MKKTFYILIFVLTFYSCLNMNDPESQAKYIECYNLFDKELVDHFPSKLPNNQIGYGFSNPEYYSELRKYSDIPNHSDIYLTKKISSKEKYKELKKKYSKNAKYINASNSKCFAIIRTYETNIDNKYDTTCNELYPVPEFAIFEYGENNKNWIRIENGQIIILDFKSGNYTSSKKIKPNREMPKEFQNGYSKGLTFNDQKQTIEYWLIIW